MLTALFESTLSNALVAAAMALILILAGRLQCVQLQPSVRHLLWLLVLAKLVVPTGYVLGHIDLSEFGQPAAPRSQNIVADAAVLEVTDISEWDTTAFVEVLPTLDEVAAQASVASVAVYEVAPTPAEPIWPWVVVGVSLTATGAIVVRGACRARRLARIVARAGAAPPELVALLLEVCARMDVRQVPRLCVVDARLTPLMWLGNHGATIVLPRKLVEELDARQIECILGHELAHYARGDHWANLFASGVASLFWWHPTAWWSGRELRAAQELCCDAAVLAAFPGARRLYAQTLLQAIDFVQGTRASLPAMASGFGETLSLKRRFEMLSNPQLCRRRPWWTWPCVLVAMCVLPAGLVVGESAADETTLVNEATVEDPVTGDSAAAISEEGTVELVVDDGAVLAEVQLGDAEVSTGEVLAEIELVEADEVSVGEVLTEVRLVGADEKSNGDAPVQVTTELVAESATDEKVVIHVAEADADTTIKAKLKYLDDAILSKVKEGKVDPDADIEIKSKPAESKLSILDTGRLLRIVMRDGETIVGEVARQDETLKVIRTPEGEEITINIDHVQSIRAAGDGKQGLRAKLSHRMTKPLDKENAYFYKRKFAGKDEENVYHLRIGADGKSLIFKDVPMADVEVQSVLEKLSAGSKGEPIVVNVYATKEIPHERVIEVLSMVKETGNHVVHVAGDEETNVEVKTAPVYQYEAIKDYLPYAKSAKGEADGDSSADVEKLRAEIEHLKAELEASRAELARLAKFLKGDVEAQVK